MRRCLLALVTVVILSDQTAPVGTLAARVVPVMGFWRGGGSGCGAAVVLLRWRTWFQFRFLGLVEWLGVCLEFAEEHREYRSWE